MNLIVCVLSEHANVSLSTLNDASPAVTQKYTRGDAVFATALLGNDNVEPLADFFGLKPDLEAVQVHLHPTSTLAAIKGQEGSVVGTFMVWTSFGGRGGWERYPFALESAAIRILPDVCALIVAIWAPSTSFTPSAST